MSKNILRGADMAIHNKSHYNHALLSLNKMRKDSTLKYKTAKDFVMPDKIMLCLNIIDCCEFIKNIPDESVQLICVDPPYNLELAGWDVYDNYVEWAAIWLEESYRILSKNGSMVIFGGIQFRDMKSGDLIDIIHHVRKNTKFKLVNTIVWRYKNGMSAHRYFANRHEEVIWLTKTNDYYFDLDSVREPYAENELEAALKDKRLNPQNTLKGKNPTNVWEINRLNGNSKERVGHPTQKPFEIIDRLVKALSYPGSVVLDFFAGSGIIGRVCINEGRHCLMCDRDETTTKYFKKHLEIMRKSGQCTDYESVVNTNDFFMKLKEDNLLEIERQTTI